MGWLTLSNGFSTDLVLVAYRTNIISKEMTFFCKFIAKIDFSNVPSSIADLDSNQAVT